MMTDSSTYFGAADYMATDSLPHAEPSLPAAEGSNSWFVASTLVLSALRLALRQAIGFSAGIGQKSSDVQKRFGVRIQLSWEIYCVVADGDVANCVSNIPSAGSMKRLYNAMREKGVLESDVCAVEQAYDAFVAHVNETSGDRTTFNAMLAHHLGGDVAAQNELVHREASFEAQRYVSGVEQNLNVLTHIVHPAAVGPNHVDIVCLLKRCRVLRLNFGQPFKVAQWDHPLTDEGKPSRALDEAALAKYGVPILPKFCSHPELPLRREKGDFGSIVEWEPAQVGPRGAVDFALGFINRDVPLQMRSDLFGLEMSLIFQTALRRVVFDVLVHRPTYGAIKHSVSRYGSVHKTPSGTIKIEAAGFPVLPAYEKIEFMGNAASGVHLLGVSDYGKMLEFACEKMKWKLPDFDLYRLAIDYPFVDTMSVRTFRFPNIDH